MTPIDRYNPRMARSRKIPDIALPEGQALPIADPAAELPPTAQRILAAAQRVLAREGFAGLTLEAISAEAGENKSAVWYYFGGKDGLITALVHSFDHEDSRQLLEQLASDDGERDRLEVFVRVQRDGARRLDMYRSYFDLLPHMLRDKKLCEGLAKLMIWYRDLDQWALAPLSSSPDLEALCMLTVAVTDGLAIQYAADREVDIDAAFALWERLIRTALEQPESLSSRPESSI